jgi:hypothetical protein
MRRTVRGLSVLVVSLAALAALAGDSAPAGAGTQAVVPGFVCTTYAQMPFPVDLDFDAAGNLYVGNEESLQGVPTITVTAKDVDVGAYAPGPGVVTIRAGLGSDARGVSVRMVRSGRSLKY